MKKINNYILEKLRLNKNTKYNYQAEYKKGDIVLVLTWWSNRPGNINCTLFKIIDFNHNKIGIQIPEGYIDPGYLDFNDDNYNNQGYICIEDNRHIPYCIIPQNEVEDFLKNIKENNYQIDSTIFCNNKIKDKYLEVSFTKDELESLIDRFKNLIK